MQSPPGSTEYERMSKHKWNKQGNLGAIKKYVPLYEVFENIF